MADSIFSRLRTMPGIAQQPLDVAAARSAPPSRRSKPANALPGSRPACGGASPRLGLRAFEGDPVEQVALVTGRDSPFFVVVGDV